MTGPGLLYSLVTGVAFLLFVVVVILAIKKRPAPVPAPREPIGYFTEISFDENGVYARGVLTEEGVSCIRRGDMTGISIGFKQDGTVIDASPVLDPRPCKGDNTNVCVAEGCYGEACVKKWLTRQP